MTDRQPSGPLRLHPIDLLFVPVVLLASYGLLTAAPGAMLSQAIAIDMLAPLLATAWLLRKAILRRLLHIS